MEIIIKEYQHYDGYYALTIKGYEYNIQLGWIKFYLFNDSAKEFSKFLRKVKYSKTFIGANSSILFETIRDAQRAIDILNSIVILNTLTQN